MRHLCPARRGPHTWQLIEIYNHEKVLDSVTIVIIQTVLNTLLADSVLHFQSQRVLTSMADSAVDFER